MYCPEVEEYGYKILVSLRKYKLEMSQMYVMTITEAIILVFFNRNNVNSILCIFLTTNFIFRFSLNRHFCAFLLRAGLWLLCTWVVGINTGVFEIFLTIAFFPIYLLLIQWAHIIHEFLNYYLNILSRRIN